MNNSRNVMVQKISDLLGMYIYIELMITIQMSDESSSACRNELLEYHSVENVS